MRRFFFIHTLAMSFFVALATPSVAAKKPTSEIPARREFPLSTEVSPCTNFFDYVCKPAIDGFALREDRSRHIFSFSDSHERLLEKKKTYLEELRKNPGAKRAARSQELGDIFTACMDEKASAQEEKEIVAERIAKIQGMKTREEFLKFLGTQVDSPEYSFLQFGTDGNLDNPDWNDVYLLGSLQSLPERSYYGMPEVMKDFEALALELFKTAGLDEPAKRAKQVADFEKEFAGTYPTPEEFRELFSKRTGIDRKKLKSEFPNFQLVGFLDKLPKRTHIRHLSPANFKFLNEALANRSLDELKSVYFFHALPDYMDDAFPDFYKKRFEFKRKHLGGPNQRPPRDERCTTMVMDRFTKELDAELLPIVFPNFPREKFVALAESVRSSIVAGLKRNRWLSPSAKKEAILKITKAGFQLVSPTTDEEWDFNLPADYDPKKPYSNGRLYRTKEVEKQLAELAKPRNKAKWEMGPLTINAYYSPSDNKFVMPIGILQYPFYDPSLSNYSNLGAVGVVIGHELGHGIDDKGARYDVTGKLRQWMTASDLKEFQSRSSALVKQFEAAHHNGNLTLGENIGDLVGVSFAYQAAFPDPAKATLNDQKDFFVQYGRLWCGVMRPKMREQLLKVDPHALVDARVNEQVKHQAAFEKVFGCKAGDPMVLPDKKRVSIW